MSRLSDLLRQVESKDPQLAADLKREFDALSKRRVFGLNFERHVPETVELPGRPIRRGDKVRFLPERGESTSSVDHKLWRVKAIRQTSTGQVADLVRKDDSRNEPETASRLLDDLVVVAEFRDPIYPGLVSTGKVVRGGDKPFHTVINAENFHALQALLYTHEGEIDAIYIDPPYNTGARDWKYNNDYVDSDDAYRHSKWLAMMERRLLLAKRLLNPADSVLICSIDEKEFLRLGLLLEQIFPDAAARDAGIQMITSVISAKGAVRNGKFSRVEEHIFIVSVGGAVARPWNRNMLDPLADDGAETAGIEWLGLRRRERSSTRGARPNQFYPIFVHADTGLLHSVGDPIDEATPRESIRVPDGTVALFPLKPDGTEMLWGLTPEVLRRNWAKGFVRINRWDAERRRGTVQYLPGGTIDRINDGTIKITGKAKDGSVIGMVAVDEENPPPKRVWNLPSHNAENGGTNVLSTLVPGREFPYPKSLYAIEDVLRFFITDKPSAVVVDFFSGSGTTAHAVMRLNRQDDGCRQSISISNNEVAAKEQEALRSKKLRPGDDEWERFGICEYITKARIMAALTGKTPDGNLVEGDYKFTDEFPMSEGFDENVEFLKLTYEAPRPMAHHRCFEAIAPLLWIKAGAQGRRIEKPSSDLDVADTYGILFDLDQSHAFIEALRNHDRIRMAFIVTDDDRAYQSVCGELPAHIEPVRLYESYLTNFTINVSEE